MSVASPFQFRGFGLCQETSPLSPKIRINLNENGSTGEAASIGPSSSTLNTNITMPYLMGARGTIEMAAINETNLSFLIVHETMHLLGFHHDKEREDQKYFNELSNVTIIGGYDRESAMSMRLEENSLINRNEPIQRTAPYLSASDRNCLNLLAERRINSSATELPVGTSNAQ